MCPAGERLMHTPFPPGFLSLDELRQAWKLFSSYMGTVSTEDCICDLAQSIDFNKDGRVDINEFLEAFRLVEQSCSEGATCDPVKDSSCSGPWAP